MYKKITCILAALMCSLLPLAQTTPVAGAQTDTVIPVIAIQRTIEIPEGLGITDPYAVLKEGMSYSIVPAHAGSCVIENGTSKAMLNKANRGDSQRWQLKKIGDACSIRTDDGKTALEVSGGKAGSGIAVVPAKTDSSNPAKQLWVLEDAGDGTFFIRSKLNASYAMDVYGSRQDNGTAVNIHQFNGMSNQRFRFVNLSETVPMSEWGATRSDCLGSDWDYWDGGIDQNWYYANKNASSYEISTASQLAGAARLVKDKVTNFEGKTLQLTRDLDLCGAEWQPIGTSDRPFCGSFNGNNHAIVGLSITGKGDEVGFFGHVSGGSICNFAIRGRVSGDWNTGGVCGKLERGHLVNVYSEVTITRATNDNCGGLCGRVSYGAYVEHCTQNARITSTSSEPDRGGIGGYCTGVIRWCVNKQTVDSRWDYVGGIAGHLVDGKIEYCANYGQVCGGKDTESAGGIFGKGEKDAYVCGCYNSGYVWSSGDDYVGGIGGRIVGDTPKVFRCVNTGDVKGRKYIGGVLGEGNCTACLNNGYVSGSSKIGAITGNTKYKLDYCLALSWTAANLNGKGGKDNNGAEWCSPNSIQNGEACVKLNNKITISGYGQGCYPVLYQNLGSDTVPVFSGAKVEKKDTTYRNKTNQPTLIYDKNAGEVTMQNASGSTTLQAVAYEDYLFDRFEIYTVRDTSRSMYNGSHGCYVQDTTTVTDPEYVLKTEADKAFTVKAVFREDDGTPDDLRQVVEVELKTVKGSGSWKSESVPVYLTDTSGVSHLWEIQRSDIDNDGDTVKHSFDLGTAFPIAVCLYPNTSANSLTVQAKIRFNDAEDVVESDQIKINSGWNEDSMSGSKYIYIPFLDYGKSKVGKLDAEGNITGQKEYTKCSEALAAAAQLGKDAVITLESPWLTKEQINLSSGKTSIDLNGYPIIRCLRQKVKSGCVFNLEKGAELCITDSAPTRKSGSVFTGGSIQGGRSKNTAGLIQVNADAKLTMTGGTLYNGGSWNNGGAIQNKQGTVVLDGVLISGCRTFDNSGGGIYTDKGTMTVKNTTIKNCRGKVHSGALFISNGTVTLENVEISGCRSEKKEGGAIYIDKGSLHYKGGEVRECLAPDDGGAIFQNKGTLLCEDVLFQSNFSPDSGGALYVDTGDSTWLVGCSFLQNICHDDGAAIYFDGSNNYMDGCTVINNAAKDQGAIKVEDDSALDVCGKMIIKSNDGSGTMDNLIFEKGGYLYDCGLMNGSEVHLRSTKSGNVRLANDKHGLISDYAMNHYLVSDCGTLKLDKVETRSSALQASVFSEDSIAIYIGGVLIAAALIGGLIYARKRKEEKA